MNLHKFIVTCMFAIILVAKSVRSLLEIDDSKDFKQLLRTRNNVLAYFHKSDNNEWPNILSEIAKELEGRATIVSVNCKNSKKLCAKEKANPSPAVLKHYKEGKYHKDYDRSKSVKSVVRFLEDPAGEAPWIEDPSAKNVVHLEDKSDFVKLVVKHQREKPILILFYTPWCEQCKRLKPEYAAAANEVHKEVVLAAMDLHKPDNQIIRQQFNITGFPTLYYIRNGEILFPYGGEFTKDGFISWLKDPKPPKEPAKEEDWADEEEAKNIHFLTKASFSSFLHTNPSVLVMFYAPWCGHCKAMKPEYNLAAQTLSKENVIGSLVAVDGSKERDLMDQFKITGFPSVKYFRDGQFKYDVPVRSAEKIIEFMKDPKEPAPPEAEKAWSEEESDVNHLTDENFRSFVKSKKHVLVMFYAPWCGHCKKAKPEFTKAAATVKDERKIAYAAIDCTVHQKTCQQEDVNGYPTIKYYSFGKENIKYTGGREEEDFVAFMSDPENPKKPSQRRHWKTIANHEAIHLLDTDNFDDELSKMKGLLVMFYAPWCGHCINMKPVFAEAASLILSETTEYGFGAVEATAQKELASKYKISGYPTLLYFKSDGSYVKYDKERSIEDFVEFIRSKKLNDEQEVAAAKAEEERKQKELEEQLQREQEAKRQEEDRIQKEEAERVRREEERVKKEEEERLRREEERLRREEEERLRREEERLRKEEEERLRREEEERLRKEQEKITRENAERIQKESDEPKITETQQEPPISESASVKDGSKVEL